MDVENEPLQLDETGIPGNNTLEIYRPQKDSSSDQEDSRKRKEHRRELISKLIDKYEKKEKMLKMKEQYLQDSINQLEMQVPIIICKHIMGITIKNKSTSGVSVKKNDLNEPEEILQDITWQPGQEVNRGHSSNHSDPSEVESLNSVDINCLSKLHDLMKTKKHLQQEVKDLERKKKIFLQTISKSLKGSLDIKSIFERPDPVMHPLKNNELLVDSIKQKIDKAKHRSNALQNTIAAMQKDHDEYFSKQTKQANEMQDKIKTIMEQKEVEKVIVKDLHYKYNDMTLEVEKLENLLKMQTSISDTAERNYDVTSGQFLGDLDSKTNSTYQDSAGILMALAIHIAQTIRNIQIYSNYMEIRKEIVTIANSLDKMVESVKMAMRIRFGDLISEKEPDSDTEEVKVEIMYDYPRMNLLMQHVDKAISKICQNAFNECNYQQRRDFSQVNSLINKISIAIDQITENVAEKIDFVTKYKMESKFSALFDNKNLIVEEVLNLLKELVDEINNIENKVDLSEIGTVNVESTVEESSSHVQKIVTYDDPDNDVSFYLVDDLMRKILDVIIKISSQTSKDKKENSAVSVSRKQHSKAVTISQTNGDNLREDNCDILPKDFTNENLKESIISKDGKLQNTTDEEDLIYRNVVKLDVYDKINQQLVGLKEIGDDIKHLDQNNLPKDDQHGVNENISYTVNKDIDTSKKELPGSTNWKETGVTLQILSNSIPENNSFLINTFEMSNLPKQNELNNFTKSFRNPPHSASGSSSCISADSNKFSLQQHLDISLPAGQILIRQLVKDSLSQANKNVLKALKKANHNVVHAIAKANRHVECVLEGKLSTVEKSMKRTQQICYSNVNINGKTSYRLNERNLNVQGRDKYYKENKVSGETGSNSSCIGSLSQSSITDATTESENYDCSLACQGSASNTSSRLASIKETSFDPDPLIRDCPFCDNKKIKMDLSDSESEQDLKGKSKCIRICDSEVNYRVQYVLMDDASKGHGNTNLFRNNSDENVTRGGTAGSSNEEISSFHTRDSSFVIRTTYETNYEMTAESSVPSDHQSVFLKVNNTSDHADSTSIFCSEKRINISDKEIFYSPKIKSSKCMNNISEQFISSIPTHGDGFAKVNSITHINNDLFLSNIYSTDNDINITYCTEKSIEFSNNSEQGLMESSVTDKIASVNVQDMTTDNMALPKSSLQKYENKLPLNNVLPCDEDFCNRTSNMYNTNENKNISYDKLSEANEISYVNSKNIKLSKALKETINVTNIGEYNSPNLPLNCSQPLQVYSSIMSSRKDYEADEFALHLSLSVHDFTADNEELQLNNADDRNNGSYHEDKCDCVHCCCSDCLHRIRDTHLVSNKKSVPVDGTIAGTKHVSDNRVCYCRACPYSTDETFQKLSKHSFKEKLRDAKHVIDLDISATANDIPATVKVEMSTAAGNIKTANDQEQNKQISCTEEVCLLRPLPIKRETRLLKNILQSAISISENMLSNKQSNNYDTLCNVKIMKVNQNKEQDTNRFNLDLEKLKESIQPYMQQGNVQTEIKAEMISPRTYEVDTNVKEQQSQFQTIAIYQKNDQCMSTSSTGSETLHLHTDIIPSCCTTINTVIEEIEDDQPCYKTETKLQINQPITIVEQASHRSNAHFQETEVSSFTLMSEAEQSAARSSEVSESFEICEDILVDGSNIPVENSEYTIIPSDRLESSEQDTLERTEDYSCKPEVCLTTIRKTDVEDFKEIYIVETNISIEDTQNQTGASLQGNEQTRSRSGTSFKNSKISNQTLQSHGVATNLPMNIDSSIQRGQNKVESNTSPIVDQSVLKLKTVLDTQGKDNEKIDSPPTTVLAQAGRDTSTGTAPPKNVSHTMPLLERKDKINGKGEGAEPSACDCPNCSLKNCPACQTENELDKLYSENIVQNNKTSIKTERNDNAYPCSNFFMKMNPVDIIEELDYNQLNNSCNVCNCIDCYYARVHSEGTTQATTEVNNTNQNANENQNVNQNQNEQSNAPLQSGDNQAGGCSCKSGSCSCQDCLSPNPGGAPNQDGGPQPGCGANDCICVACNCEQCVYVQQAGDYSFSATGGGFGGLDACDCPICVCNETEMFLLQGEDDNCDCPICSCDADMLVSAQPEESCLCPTCICNDCSLLTEELKKKLGGAISHNTMPFPGCTCEECMFGECLTALNELSFEKVLGNCDCTECGCGECLFSKEIQSQNITAAAAAVPGAGLPQHKKSSCKCAPCDCDYCILKKGLGQGPVHEDDCTCPECACLSCSRKSKRCTCADCPLKQSLGDDKISGLYKKVPLNLAHMCTCKPCGCTTCQLFESDNADDEATATRSIGLKPAQKKGGIYRNVPKLLDKKCRCTPCVCGHCNGLGESESVDSFSEEIDSCPCGCAELVETGATGGSTRNEKKCDCIMCIGQDCDFCKDGGDHIIAVALSAKLEKNQQGDSLKESVLLKGNIISGPATTTCDCVTCECNTCPNHDEHCTCTSCKCKKEDKVTTHGDGAESKISPDGNCTCGQCDCVVCAFKATNAKLGEHKYETKTIDPLNICDCCQCECVICLSKDSSTQRNMSNNKTNIEEVKSQQNSTRKLKCECPNCKCDNCLLQKEEKGSMACVSKNKTNKITSDAIPSQKPTEKINCDCLNCESSCVDCPQKNKVQSKTTDCNCKSSPEKCSACNTETKLNPSQTGNVKCQCKCCSSGHCSSNAIQKDNHRGTGGDSNRKQSECGCKQCSPEQCVPQQCINNIGQNQNIDSKKGAKEVKLQQNPINVNRNITNTQSGLQGDVAGNTADKLKCECPNCSCENCPLQKETRSTCDDTTHDNKVLPHGCKCSKCCCEKIKTPAPIHKEKAVRSCDCIKCSCVDCQFKDDNKDTITQLKDNPITGPVTICKCNTCKCVPCPYEQTTLSHKDGDNACECLTCQCGDKCLAGNNAANAIVTLVGNPITGPPTICKCNTCKCIPCPYQQTTQSHKEGDKACDCPTCQCGDGCLGGKNIPANAIVTLTGNPITSTSSICKCDTCKCTPCPHQAEKINTNLLTEQTTSSHKEGDKVCDCPMCQCGDGCLAGDNKAANAIVTLVGNPITGPATTCKCDVCKCIPCPYQQTILSHKEGDKACDCPTCQCGDGCLGGNNIPANTVVTLVGNPITSTPSICKCDACKCNPCPHQADKISANLLTERSTNSHKEGDNACDCPTCQCGDGCLAGKNNTANAIVTLTGNPVTGPATICKCDACKCIQCPYQADKIKTNLCNNCDCIKCECIAEGKSTLIVDMNKCGCNVCNCINCIKPILFQNDSKGKSNTQNCDCKDCDCISCTYLSKDKLGKGVKSGDKCHCEPCDQKCGMCLETKKPSEVKVNKNSVVSGKHTSCDCKDCKNECQGLCPSNIIMEENLSHGCKCVVCKIECKDCPYIGKEHSNKEGECGCQDCNVECKSTCPYNEQKESNYDEECDCRDCNTECTDSCTYMKKEQDNNNEECECKDCATECNDILSHMEGNKQDIINDRCECEKCPFKNDVDGPCDVSNCKTQCQKESCIIQMENKQTDTIVYGECDPNTCKSECEDDTCQNKQDVGHVENKQSKYAGDNGPFTEKDNSDIQKETEHKNDENCDCKNCKIECENVCPYMTNKGQSETGVECGTCPPGVCVSCSISIKESKVDKGTDHEDGCICDHCSKECEPSSFTTVLTTGSQHFKTLSNCDCIKCEEECKGHCPYMGDAKHKDGCDCNECVNDECLCTESNHFQQNKSHPKECDCIECKCIKCMYETLMILSENKCQCPVCECKDCSFKDKGKLNKQAEAGDAILAPHGSDCDCSDCECVDRLHSLIKPDIVKHDVVTVMMVPGIKSNTGAALQLCDCDICKCSYCGALKPRNESRTLDPCDCDVCRCCTSGGYSQKSKNKPIIICDKCLCSHTPGVRNKACKCGCDDASYALQSGGIDICEECKSLDPLLKILTDPLLPDCTCDAKAAGMKGRRPDGTCPCAEVDLTGSAFEGIRACNCMDTTPVPPTVSKQSVPPPPSTPPPSPPLTPPYQDKATDPEGKLCNCETLFGPNAKGGRSAAEGEEPAAGPSDDAPEAVLAPEGADIIREIGPDSILLSWQLPKSLLGLAGYHISMGGRTVSRIRSPNRTMTLLHNVDLTQSAEIEVRSISEDGEFSEPASVCFCAKKTK